MAVGKGSIRRASGANRAVKEKQAGKAEPVPEIKEKAAKTVPEEMDAEKEYKIVSAIKSDLPIHLL